jgi:DNA-binding transcriptional LysR family regulator
MSDDIGDMRFFCNVIAAGSLSEAARRHESSPPAMSRRLAAMEARLGVRLIDRSSRRFLLTQEGALLHERALPILQAVEAAQAELSAANVKPQGLLRVGAPMQLGRRLIAPLIGQFSERYPEVTIQFTLSDIGLDVIDDGFDIAIRAGMPDDAGIVVRRLLSSRRVVCATPDYLARHGEPQTPDDLLQHNCIRLMRRQRTFDEWRFQTPEGDVRNVQVSGTLLTSSGEVMHQWTLEGRGIGMKALWDVADDLAEGRLVECLASYASNDIALYATYPRQLHMPPRMRVFLDFVGHAMQDV